MRLSAPLVLALVGSAVRTTSSIGPFIAGGGAPPAGCAEAAALAATGDLRAARRLAIQLIGPSAGLDVRRACSEQWLAATDPELGTAAFVNKIRQSQSASPAQITTRGQADRPKPLCWWNQGGGGPVDARRWSRCCAEVDPENVGPTDPALCFGHGGDHGDGGQPNSADPTTRGWCCGFGLGSDSYAAIPALLEPFISVRLPGPAGRLLRLQQGGFLRPFVKQLRHCFAPRTYSHARRCMLHVPACAVEPLPATAQTSGVMPGPGDEVGRWFLRGVVGGFLWWSEGRLLGWLMTRWGGRV